MPLHGEMKTPKETARDPHPREWREDGDPPRCPSRVRRVETPPSILRGGRGRGASPEPLQVALGPERAPEHPPGSGQWKSEFTEIKFYNRWEKKKKPNQNLQKSNFRTHGEKKKSNFTKIKFYKSWEALADIDSPKESLEVKTRTNHKAPAPPPPGAVPIFVTPGGCWGSPPLNWGTIGPPLIKGGDRNEK